jgi:4-hydroxy-3-methylbut-2-enyl diphosphate reductase
MGAEILLAQPRGFCAGVDRAIDIVERAIEIHGAPIYVRHEIVHNRFVVQDLRDKGAVFIDELEQAPTGAIVVFSAHGVSKAVREEAAMRGLQVFDATCPLVTKVHVEVARMRAAGHEIIMIGHKGHPEVEGTLGQLKDGMYLVETVQDVQDLVVTNPDNLAFVTQTTLSVDDAAAVAAALKARFSSIVEPKKSDICYATQNRQDAVKMMAPQCDLVLVVGSANSSNSNRLREVGERMGITSYLIDGPESIDPAWLTNKSRIGISAGASAPDVLVQQVIKRLKALGAVSVRNMEGLEEHVSFPLPKGLSRQNRADDSAARQVGEDLKS